MHSGRIALSTLLCCGGVALAQAPSPQFEVASVRVASTDIRLTGPGEVSGGPGTSDPTRIRYHNVPFVQLVMLACGLNTEAGFVNDGLVTPAAWMRNDQYEIVANIQPGATLDQVRIMLQKLLADRFALRVHREIQKFGGSEVVIAREGPKLQPNHSPNLTRLPMNKDALPGKDGFPEVPAGYAGLSRSYHQGRVYITGVGQSISDLLGIADFRYDHVVDKTGLGEKYDFHFVYSGPSKGVAADPSVPDLYGALEKQLGLKVRSATVSIDVLVIDGAREIPEEN